MAEAFICDAVRTPIGRYGGSLSSIRSDDLASLPIKALLDRYPNVDWQAVDVSEIEDEQNCGSNTCGANR